MTQLDQYVDKREVATLTGMTTRAVERRMADGVVEVWRDPRDHRRRLIKRADIARLVELVAVPRRAAQAADLAVA